MLVDDLFASPSLLRQSALLLDIDGTLAAFELDPSASVIPPATLQCLDAIVAQGVPVCFVTGRSVCDAQSMTQPMTQPLSLPIAGTHGLEIFDPASSTVMLANTISLERINALHTTVQALFAPYPLLIETKPYSVAVHCRAYPALADTAQRLVNEVVSQFPDWTVKTGKCVWEILPKGVNKGQGIERLLALLSRQGRTVRCPIFIGDDVTDEAGFEVVNRLGGISIKVGDGETQAKGRLPDVAAVAMWLQQLLQCLAHAPHPTE